MSDVVPAWLGEQIEAHKTAVFESIMAGGTGKNEIVINAEDIFRLNQ